jgi:hypothetical protein
MCAELRIGFMNYIFAHSMALLQQRISTNFLTSLHITYQVVTALPNCDFWVHKNLIQNDLNVDALLRKFPNLTKLVILGETLAFDDIDFDLLNSPTLGTSFGRLEDIYITF